VNVEKALLLNFCQYLTISKALNFKKINYQILKNIIIDFVKVILQVFISEGIFLKFKFIKIPRAVMAA
jgi:hypothetical protein